MSIFVNTKERSDSIEIMDDLSMDGKLLLKTLDQLATINKWLGGNAITLNGIKILLKKHPVDTPLTIVDLGCGGGDMLRKVADFGRKNGYAFKLTGIDANQHTIEYARKLSKNYPEIGYLHQDVFSKEFKKLSYDIVLATLFIHHFKGVQLVNLINMLKENASIGVVVNDLHRHPMAYYLFKLLSITISNRMVKQDGLTSILRGFKKEELEKISTQLRAKSRIDWKWAFRYQWIIQNK